MPADRDKKRKEEEKRRKAYQRRKTKRNEIVDKGEKKICDGLIPISEPCPIGWMQVKMLKNKNDPEGEGELFWADPEKLIDDGKQINKLTTDQMERIRAFRQIIAEHDDMTEERTFFEFSKDKNPEQEIQIWERIASAYRTEMELRPDADEDERGLLYAVLVTASNVGMDSKLIVSSLPKAKLFSHLERALHSFAVAN